MADELSGIINIGKDTQAKLKQAGINSFDELKSLGSKQAFLRLQAFDAGACLSLLYGLEGAIEGVKWSSLSPAKKQDLKEFITAAKKR